MRAYSLNRVSGQKRGKRVDKNFTDSMMVLQ